MSIISPSPGSVIALAINSYTIDKENRSVSPILHLHVYGYAGDKEM